MKTAVKWLKEQSTEFYEAGIHALIQRWNIAIERNGDYVENLGCDPQRTSFILCMIHVPVSVIILLLKKKALLLMYPCIYIYI